MLILLVHQKRKCNISRGYIDKFSPYKIKKTKAGYFTRVKDTKESGFASGRCRVVERASVSSCNVTCDKQGHLLFSKSHVKAF